MSGRPFFTSKGTQMRIIGAIPLFLFMLTVPSRAQDVVVNTPSGPITIQYDQNNKQVIIKVGVGVTPNPPAPTPTPTPNPPTPTPILPAGKYGLAQVAYDAFASDGNMTSRQKSVVANALATGFEGIASKVAAVTTYTDIAQILADTTKANDDALSKVEIDRSLTLGPQSIIGQKFKDLYVSQKVSTAADIAVAWREIAQGLKAVK
jgi:hypothetical protein